MGAFPQFALADIFEMTLPQVRLWSYLAVKNTQRKAEMIGHYTGMTVAQLLSRTI